MDFRHIWHRTCTYLSQILFAPRAYARGVPVFIIYCILLYTRLPSKLNRPFLNVELAVLSVCLLKIMISSSAAHFVSHAVALARAPRQQWDSSDLKDTAHQGKRVCFDLYETTTLEDPLRLSKTMAETNPSSAEGRGVLGRRPRWANFGMAASDLAVYDRVFGTLPCKLNAVFCPISAFCM